MPQAPETLTAPNAFIDSEIYNPDEFRLPRVIGRLGVEKSLIVIGVPVGMDPRNEDFIVDPMLEWEATTSDRPEERRIFVNTSNDTAAALVASLAEKLEITPTETPDSQQGELLAQQLGVLWDAGKSCLAVVDDHLVNAIEAEIKKWPIRDLREQTAFPLLERGQVPNLSELYNPPEPISTDSLARKENWPDWARSLLRDKNGLNALRRLKALSDDFYFLGMPYLLEELRPRESLSTNPEGGYFQDGPSKVSFVEWPECAVLRAIVCRPGLERRGVSDVDERCWSGWVPEEDRLVPITTADMARYLLHDFGMGFVAVCSGDRLRLAGDVTRFDNKPGEVHVLSDDPDFSIEPDLIVPVASCRDFPRNTLVIAEEVTRKEATTVFRMLNQRPKFEEIPETVSASSRKLSLISLVDLVGK